MDRLIDTTELKRLFADGVNIMEHMRTAGETPVNSATAILYSYDLQAGTYTQALDDPAYVAFKDRRAAVVADIVDPLGPATILDVGTGEATSLVPLLKHLHRPRGEVLAFDLSLSRVLFARRHLAAHGFAARLFSGSMLHIPLADNSIDVALTYHAAEPNGGREHEIVRELLRVTRRRLVMMEPSHELGSPATKARIERLGYVRNLTGAIETLGHRIVRHELLESWRPDNETGLIVVDKTPQGEPDLRYRSPISGSPLELRDGFLYSPIDGFAFPIIEGIPCLNPDNGVLAARLDAAKD